MSFAGFAALLPMQPPAAPPSGAASGSSCPGGLPQFVCSAAGAVTHPLDTAQNAAGAVVSGAASDAFDGMVNKLKDGVGHAVGLMMSYWMHIPIPAIGDTGSAVDRLRQATLYLTVLTGVVSIFFVVIKAVFAHHQAASEESMNAATGLVRIIIASVVAIPTVILLSKGGDEYSQWLVDQAANGDVGKAVLKLMAFDTITGSPGFTFGLALIALFASLVQAFLIVIRDALLILLVGTLPLAAAASITSAGRQTWNKMIAWLIAFLLFKPVAAMCYAGALWSVTNAHNEIDAIAGIFLVILAVLVLPALMRLISPSVARVGGGGGGGALLAGAAGGAAATGARMMSGASRSTASSGGGGGGGGGGKARFLGEQGASGSRPAPGGPPRGASSSQRPGGAPGGGGGKSPAGGAAGGGKAAGGPAVMAVQAGAQAAKGAHQAVTKAANEAVDGGGQ